MRQDVLLFFDGHRDTLPAYEAFETLLLRQHPQTQIKIQKTQITFSNRHVFACVSFMRPKRKAELPRSCFVLTLGLPYPLDSARAAAKAEPCPGRWTAHIVISGAAEVDPELAAWIKEAYEFADHK